MTATTMITINPARGNPVVNNHNINIHVMLPALLIISTPCGYDVGIEQMKVVVAPNATVM